jgi:uncharacterized protein YajQ (UPF0234 family)
MPSFDIVSEINLHELMNAVDQANREISNRFDFKGVKASFQLNKETITLRAPTDFQIKQMQDILENKLVNRQLDIRCIERGDIKTNLAEATQEITIKQGIDKEQSKVITKLIKDSKVKVQTAIQGEQIRVTGKKRDELQEIIAILRNTDLSIPLQYTNFRD